MYLLEIEIHYGLGIQIRLDIRNHIAGGDQDLFQDFPFAQSTITLEHHLLHRWFFLDGEHYDHTFPGIVPRFRVGFDRFEVV
jgi:hypothetical protein